LFHALSIIKQRWIESLFLKGQFLDCLLVIKHKIPGTILGEAGRIVFFGESVVVIQDGERELFSIARLR
jgi:hypothetical protein